MIEPQLRKPDLLPRERRRRPRQLCREAVEIAIPMQRDKIDRAAGTRLHKRRQPHSAGRGTGDCRRAQLNPVGRERLDRCLPRVGRALRRDVAAAPVRDHVGLVEADYVLDLGHGVAHVRHERVGVVAPEHWYEFQGRGSPDDGGRREVAVAVVPGHGGLGADEDAVVFREDGGRDVDQPALGIGGDRRCTADGESEGEEGEGVHGAAGGGCAVVWWWDDGR